MIWALDDSTEAPPIPNLHKSYGAVGFIINPLVPYHTVAKYSSQTIQSLTIRTNAATTTAILRIPKENCAEEAIILREFYRLSDRRGIIMGDINAGLSTWVTKNNAREKRLKR